MPATTYLFFNGNCAEAMKFYEKTLGGKLEALMTYKEAPGGNPCPAAFADKIMHARLVLPDGSAIMASDDAGGAPYKGMSGFGIAIDVATAMEGKRVFDAFADGGQILMPFQKTFWAEAFGGVNDRFGTPWMISAEPVQQ
jgi:PhnB protein